MFILKDWGVEKNNLNETDKIVLFYSENAKNMTVDLHIALEKIKAKIEYIKVKVGTANALDFQLASYLGAYIEKNKSQRYFIISKDSGFDAVCNFWKGRGVLIERIDVVSVVDKNKEAVVKALSNILSEKDALKVYKIICDNKTKADIHNNITKEFPSEGNKKAPGIYKAIKSFIKDKKADYTY